MTRKQKRERCARIRREQKAKRALKKNYPYDLKHQAQVAEHFVEVSKEFVADYSGMLLQTKKIILIFLTLCIIFGTTLIFNPGIYKTWNKIIFDTIFVLTVFPVVKYRIDRKQLSFWKDHLQENMEFLQNTKLRLQRCVGTSVREKIVNYNLNDHDLSLCVEWAKTYFKGKFPTKDQFEAMQRKGFLPTYGEGDGRRWELHYGHYGWHVDYDWPAIAAKIMATVKTC